ncbi:MAG: peptidase M61 [Saprospiraceae bacterium]|nr:peptidase M61 [Saprospiraceae bacterium]MCC6414231.1 peptidase M61 [Saprospiraceae bacterium]
MHYKIDLLTIVNDKVYVQLETPKQDKEVIDFLFPRIVPGIYGTMHFAENVNNLKAYDASGRALEVERPEPHRFRIRNADELAQIRYHVDDGWDEFDEKYREGFYRSAESSFHFDSFAVINHNSLIGYFEGQSNLPVQLDVYRPGDWYGATTLHRGKSTYNMDVFRADSYRELVDNPILYTRPDTVWLHIGETDVCVAAFSNTGQKLARGIANNIEPLLRNQAAYLGGKLPVDAYCFMMYHALGSPNSYSGDGLEHATSTLCLLQCPLDSGAVGDFVYGLASHEFFHIVTPLNIHSENIQEYDFVQPTMSRHLWLYEGMTEYATIHMPVWQGMDDGFRSFLQKIADKLQQMSKFDDALPLEKLSLEAMERQDQYYNVYLKGTFVCLLLDLELRQRSHGKYGTRDLMRDLSARYGPDKPFVDADLYQVIADMTYPEIREFFSRYVEGSERLPLEEALLKAGIVVDSQKFNVSLVRNPTPEQAQLRKWWINQ